MKKNWDKLFKHMILLTNYQCEFNCESMDDLQDAKINLLAKNLKDLTKYCLNFNKKG